MDAEFPSNSQRAPKSKQVQPEQTEPKAPAEESAKKIEKIVTGEVVQRKRPMSKRVRDTLIGGDSDSVGQYVVMDVIVPAAKDMIADAFTQFIERMIFGESTGRRTNRNSGVARAIVKNGYTSYDRVGQAGGRREEPRRSMSQKGRATHDLNEIVLESRAEAEAVLSQMYDLLAQFDMVSLSELYDMVGISSNFIERKFGWTNLSGSGVRRIRGGYVLELPRPEQLD